MRRYTPKDDVQKQAYYSDRFRVPDQIEKEPIENDPVFVADMAILTQYVTVQEAYIQRGQLVVFIDASDNIRTLTCLKEIAGYTQLSEMSAIDFIASRGGFEIFYQLLSMSKRKRIRIKCFIRETENIESVFPLFSSADWAEREMFDMFGIHANNHPRLKRLLLPEDWMGHPLRKEYPLQGDEFAQWYEVDKIFGKEARDIIGPEQRDAAYVDRYDTTRFSRLGHEVKNGEPYKDEITPIQYQEDDKPPLVERFDPEQTTFADRNR